MRKPKVKQLLSALTKRVLPKILPGKNLVSSALKGITNLRSKKLKYEPNKYNDYKTMAELAYEPDSNIISSKAKEMGYHVDPALSSKESTVFVNPTTNRATVAYRGTVPSWKDVKSDLAIMTGFEKHDSRFRQANRHFSQVKDKYKDFKLDTTGHSLGGQLAKYVNDKNKGAVDTNVSFSRGTGFLEPFRSKKRNTIDISNKNDLISLGARLQGGKQIIESQDKNFIKAHNISDLFTKDTVSYK
jgi:hypothetical protein